MTLLMNCYKSKTQPNKSQEHSTSVSEDEQVNIAPCKAIRNPESKKIFACRIRNSSLWNPESCSRNLESGIWNPVPEIRNPQRGIRNTIRLRMRITLINEAINKMLREATSFGTPVNL